MERKVIVMNENQTEIKIPKVNFPGDDKKLLERIIKFREGTIRIIIFTLVGFVMGFFGYTYTKDSFIVTKIIFAIPYKVSEAIYTTIIGTGVSNPNDLHVTEFFPQSRVATLLAEHFTPIFLGGAFYGTLAYFTGDKRVFTMRRFVKFVSVWIAVILIFIGCVYGINAKAVYDNNHFKGIKHFYLTSTYKTEGIFDKKRADQLLKVFEEGLQLDATLERDSENEVQIGIAFANDSRTMIAYVNYEKNYIIAQDGTSYHISKKFANYVEKFYKKGSLTWI